MAKNDSPNDKGITGSEKPTKSIHDNEDAMRILKEADEASVPVMGFMHTHVGVQLTEMNFIPFDIQDPARQHDMCYNQILKPLKKYLKDAPKDANKIIRKEIRLFLNEGATKGRDMRQTYFYLYEQAIQVIQTWIRQYGGGNLQALFIAFYDLNQQREKNQRATT